MREGKGKEREDLSHMVGSSEKGNEKVCSKIRGSFR